MRKVKIIILLLVFVLFTVGCEDESSYRFLHDESEIRSIEIVKVKEYDQAKECYSLESLYTAENQENFLQEFQEITCFLSRGGPQGIHENDIVIMICYANGEYELIDKLGQAEFTLENEFRNYTGNFYFDVNAFDQFIHNYTDENNVRN